MDGTLKNRIVIASRGVTYVIDFKVMSYTASCVNAACIQRDPYDIIAFAIIRLHIYKIFRKVGVHARLKAF